MGYFKKIDFNNYRNFLKSTYFFSENCNIIIGKNGSGKTNILEGMSLLEKGRGFRKESIINLINYKNIYKNFHIKSDFYNNNINYTIDVYCTEKRLKKLSVNNSLAIDSIKHFESLFSIIYFLPEMERLFVASPSIRRNFLDRLIYSSYKNYNSIVNNYKKSIRERQILLKNNNYDEEWIAKIESNIVLYGNIIYQKRLSHIETLNKILKNLKAIKHFSNNFILRIKDDLLEYSPEILNDKNIYLTKLKENRKTDFFSGGCTIGPHRSDIVGFNEEDNFNLNQLSTGQQKTIVLLLIIAQSEFLIKNLNLKPIILLDEICSHLDDDNRQLLLYLIEELDIQVFMTGTDKNFFSFLSTKAHYCNIT